MLWIGGDRTQRLRCRPEQDVVNHDLILERDDLDLLRHREHHVEVGYLEQFRLAVLKPLSPREALAPRTAIVTARVVPDALMAAIAAPFDMTAECCGATGLDRAQGPPPLGRQRRTMLVEESRAEVAEHVRHFQSLLGHEPALQAGTRSGAVGVMLWRASSGLAVAQTVLVAIRRYCAVVPRS